MSLITWTDALVNGDNVTQTHITNLKSDISAVVNGNITNVNINASAAIAETKVLFSTTGHTHNGTDASYPLIKHFRRGMQVQYTSATTVTVLPGVLDVGGKLFITTTSTVLDITNPGGTHFMGGQAEPADAAVYVYAYNNSGAIGFKLSTSLPELSDSAGNVTEFPLRYHNDATLGKCRLIGIIHNRADISADMCNNFDLSNFACGSFVSDNADELVTTGWTPRFIRAWSPVDTAPDDGDAFTNFETFEFGEKTADPHLGGGTATAEVSFMHVGATHNLEAEATAGNIKEIIQQSITTAGAFTIHAPTNAIAVYWVAYTDRV